METKKFALLDCQPVKTARSERKKSIIDLPDNYIVIDIKTSGLNPQYDFVIKFGALKVRNNEVVDSFSSLVKPESCYCSDGTDYDYVLDDHGEETYFIDKFITDLAWERATNTAS